ncbi:A24 family peptidase [Desulfosporosinus sp. OT]|uniref:prepilin peptidase n=1 Tax=Desulfosporosinus sp. OT TaxID=913865 RepID=UPI000223A2D5|nr:A24 family peptidase [Desulfosporosinus sp. OT]EGW39218.1 type IV leader peptidase family protein [Desulfosporosinus sp. OT]
MLFCAVPILWAAVTDFRKRIIPDWTWIAVLLIGGVSAFLFNTPYIPLLERILGLLLPGVSLLFFAVKYGGVGGGDIKLTAAMGFSFGLCGLVVILFFALLPACIYAKATKQKSVPLAVFLCVGFFAYVSLSLFS